jgi:hypothetical protein
MGWRRGDEPWLRGTSGLRRFFLKNKQDFFEIKKIISKMGSVKIDLGQLYTCVGH